jgi:hypothetical protein
MVQTNPKGYTISKYIVFGIVYFQLRIMMVPPSATSGHCGIVLQPLQAVAASGRSSEHQLHEAVAASSRSIGISCFRRWPHQAFAASCSSHSR